MPKISFTFRGYCLTNIHEATDIDGNTVDVSGMDADVLVGKLNRHELFISLGDHLYELRKTEIEMTDFVAE